MRVVSYVYLQTRNATPIGRVFEECDRRQRQLSNIVIMTHLATGLDFRCFPLPAVGAAIKFPEQKYKCLAARFIDEIGKNVLITHIGQKRKNNV